MLVRELPADVRPREKLLARGAGALADAELVAVLLGTGVRGLPVLALAQRLLDDFGGPAGLLHAGDAGLRSAKGLGPAKRAQLAAVVELTRRALDQRLAVGDAFASPAAVKDYVRLQIGALPHEVFAVLYLDAQNRLLKLEELFRGTLTQANVYPREVVLRALALKAAAVIFAHNHPSGEAEPSQADRRLTRSLMQALALVDVRVLDHLVVAQGAAVSFAERGWL